MKNYAELIEALRYLAKVYSICENENTQEYQLAVQAADAIEKLTVAQPPLEEFEWCTDCKEYNKEKHCCHRFTKVIRQTVEELKAQHWIPVTEKLPEYGTQVLTIHKDGDYEINHVIDEEDGEWFLYGVIAWMPLPDPYKEGQE